MSVVTSYFNDTILYRRNVPYDTYSGIDSSAYTDNLPPGTQFSIGASGFGTLTDNLPISIYPSSSITSFKYPTFVDDYYYRIHVTPNVIELGNLLSVQTMDIEVWNAYMIPKLLSTIGTINAGGLNLSEPIPSPTYFAGLETRTYQLNIGTSGPPIIDAQIVFSFPAESPKLLVTGQRVTIWPYKPKYPFKESLEWKTDVIQSFNKEQRIALRDAPRQSISYDSVIEDVDFAKARAIAYQWSHRIFGAPVWVDMRQVGSIALGATYIDVDTTNADFRQNDVILLWSSNNDYEAIETLNVTSTRIYLKQPTTSARTNVSVVPSRFAYALSGITFSRDSDGLIVVTSDFDVRNNTNLDGSIGLPTYKSKQVFTDDVTSSEAVTDKYMRTIDVFDNGSGILDVDVQTNYVNITTKVSVKLFGAAAVWRFKKFIGSLYGRQKTFFIPSKSNDFEILDNISSAASSIKIANINYRLYYEGRFLMLQLNSGALYFNRIMSCSINVDGSEQLNLENSFGVNINVSDIACVSLLKHVRLDVDKLELNHSVGEQMNCSFGVKEVPYGV